MISFRKPKGFTLIELTAALAVLGLIALFGIPKIEEEWAERIVNHAASQVHDVLTASRSYRLDTQTWPSGTGNLISGGYLNSSMTVAPLGGSYTFTQVGDNFELRFSASQSIYANRLLARLPYARRIGVVDVATQIPIPGHEVSYAALDDKYYHRDGSRELTGALAGGDQDAVNLRNIEMTMLTDRDDITKVLDPSDLSVINNLTANEIDANSVRSDYVEADALNVTRTARENRSCGSTTTGNIAIDENDNRRILICVSNGSTSYWRAKQDPTQFYVDEEYLRPGSNVRADWNGAKYALVSAQCHISGGHSGRYTISANGREVLVAQHGGDSGHSDTAFGMNVVPFSSNSVRITESGSYMCTSGRDIIVLGYWK
ncbi:competence type IV pilus major pilin ComGC [Gilvimarinus polysaccharolyticus]|uniref:competence type IV pilus major pilin ComGC n=1 Tax=Gilvimarinus polysaccharolyticus TaxID=863921 RepID=UPI0006735E19|nr:prepilin-type N-terminal cleavage/methylation domain-containing protein [Gilvimarinus polysaccharolyticus]